MEIVELIVPEFVERLVGRIAEVGLVTLGLLVDIEVRLNETEKEKLILDEMEVALVEDVLDVEERVDVSRLVELVNVDADETNVCKDAPVAARVDVLEDMLIEGLLVRESDRSVVEDNEMSVLEVSPVVLDIAELPESLVVRLEERLLELDSDGGLLGDDIVESGVLDGANVENVLLENCRLDVEVLEVELCIEEVEGKVDDREMVDVKLYV